MRPDLSTLVPLRLVIPPMAAALIAEIAAWSILAWPGGAPLAPSAHWYGRPDLLVAAHLLGLGTLALSIVGAGWQLLTVVTARPPGRWTARLAGWIDAGALAGVALLVAGFVRPGPWGHLGAGLVIGALAGRSLLVVPALLRAPGRPVVRAWLLGAEACLWGGLTLGAALYAKRWGLVAVADPIAAIGHHASLLLGGWIGGWILGLGGTLLPMFAVAPEPPRAGMALGAGLYFGGLALGVPGLWAAGAALTAGLLLRALGRRAKPRLGAGLALAAFGLVGLIAAAGLALAAPGMAAVAAGFALFALPVLRGVGFRILPFLAWARVYGDDPAGAPDVTSLVPGGPIRWVSWTTAIGGVLLVSGLALGRGGAAALGVGALLLASVGHLAAIIEVARRAALGAMRRGAIAGMEVR